MPYCTQCGNAARPEDLYCKFCGARQAGSGQAGSGQAKTGAGSGAGDRQGQTPRPPRSGASPFAGAAGAGRYSDLLDRITPRTAAILCYLPTVGWMPSVTVVASGRYKNNHILRFHAFQGLYLFACWLADKWVVRPLILALPDHSIRLDSVIEAVLFCTWIFMMVKAARDEAYVLPIVGELAQRAASE